MKKNILILGFFVSLAFSFLACSDPPVVLVDPVLELNFKAVYDGEPFVLFDDLEYGDASIQITDSEFFISNVELIGDSDSKKFDDVFYVDFTRNNDNITDVLEGFDVYLGNIAAGDYSQIKFAIGIDETLNATLPADYDSSSPLSKPGNYWTTWDSYVFMRFQGLFTDQAQGVEDRGFLWHIGSDNLYREVTLDIDLNAIAGNVETINIALDHQALLNDNGNLFDILSSPENHVPVLNGAMELMADNYNQSFKVN